MGVAYELREARPEDHDAVSAFTRNTWPERDGGDYLPDVYPRWIEGEEKYTVVADAGNGEIAGIAQGVLLSDYEGWGQGMRVNPDFRGEGIAREITHEIFDWAHEQGAAVVRNMVFSWNAAGLGNSRYCGYAPATEFRWAQPEPDPDASPALDVTEDVNAAYRFWRDSDACDHLRGLALDFDESWAVSELTRDDLRRARDDTSLIAVRDGEGTKGLAYAVREYDRTWDGEGNETEPVRWVEYAVGAWADLDAGRALFDAIGRDAAERGADETRVLIPETVEAVSDVAFLRVPFSDEPDFVTAADLTADYRGR